ncbi:GNAT family N-acetyltransferase [Nocardioides sp. C4-1]|uniref:GNAT family N-acetyltransferase n=1 Tax=Nocardioides sp. C4-1 TaxID=3151851 RepID=UPI00326674B3
MTLDLVLEPDRPRDGLVGRLQRRRYAHEHPDADGARRAAERQLARVGDRGRLLAVRHDGATVGEVWLVDDGTTRSVVDLSLDDAALVAAVRRAVVSFAVADGALRLAVTVSPGDALAEAFVADGGFAPFSTQMALPLGPSLPAEGVLTLEPMDDATWRAWEEQEVEAYAAERVASGESPEQAARVSRESHAELLPDGLGTEHHHFFVGTVDGERVGSLWLETARPTAYVYDVVVDEARRRRGHGAALMRAAALWSREHGHHALGLNVFAHNHGARALYDRLGYRVTEEFWGVAL